MPIPVIIDTDPGIDDAVAILYALRSPAFDVLGLTTLAGNVGLQKTTENAGRILALAGADVPVIGGASGPMVRAPFPATHVHGGDGLGGVLLPPPTGKPRTGAAAWIARTLLDRPTGSVDLLALGPLTNVAALLTDHPEAALRLRRIIAMGGAVDEPGNVGPRAEFNMAADPEAAAIVFAAGLNLTLVPLDATRKVRASRSDCATLLASRVAEARVAGALIEAYFLTTEGSDSRPLHDPCVMLMAERPDLFHTVNRGLSIDLSHGPDAGALNPGSQELRVTLGADGTAAISQLLQVLVSDNPA